MSKESGRLRQKSGKLCGRSRGNCVAEVRELCEYDNEVERLWAKNKEAVEVLKKGLEHVHEQNQNKFQEACEQ